MSTRHFSIALGLLLGTSTGLAIPRHGKAALLTQPAEQRRFQIDFGEPLNVAASKFWLTPGGGAKTELEFDRAEVLSRKITVYVPKGRRGKVTISWIVSSLEGEPSEGEIHLNLE